MRRLKQEMYRIGGIDLWMTIAASAIAILMVVAAAEAHAQTLQVLHTFSGQGDGGEPQASLTMDRAGNLYGTTSEGGNGWGTVFKLSRARSGWVLTTLYSFQGGDDGAVPLAGVVFGPDGALYGTTSQGGEGSGFGTVFSLRPPAAVCRSTQCPWTETVLYRFSGGSDGDAPQYGNLTFDAAGNIYGTTAFGNSCGDGINCGVVFELSRSGGGWTESVLYDFTLSSGAHPYSGVTFDGAGNLYGTTSFAGAHDEGMVYKLTPSASGWTGTILHNFGLDGYQAFGSVILDAQGNIYGTTFGGGSGQPPGGTVYELQPSGGSWSYSTLYNFTGFGGATDGLAMDAAGNLYGTTFEDGAFESGNVFKLTPGAGGWTYTDLYDFNQPNDGIAPIGGVVLDGNGNLYGTTLGGGDNFGVVFEFTP